MAVAIAVAWWKALEIFDDSASGCGDHGESGGGRAVMVLAVAVIEMKVDVR